MSGQNVMLLAALALPLLLVSGVGRRGRLSALAALIAVYVPLAGAGPSLQRAGVMGLAAIAAIAASRPASRSYALLLAGAATLGWNPRAWSDPGWQLSFAAVAGILVLGVPLQRALRKAVDELAEEPASAARAPAASASQPAASAAQPSVPSATEPAGSASQPSAPSARRRHLARLRLAVLRALADGFAVTLSATLATAPLLGHHFGSVPLAGLPANLLALPAVAPVMWIGMLETALGQVGAVGRAAAAPLGLIVSLPLSYLTALAERAADAPGGQLTPPLASRVSVAAAYAALGGAALLTVRRLRRLDGALPAWAARWRALPRSSRAAAAAAFVAAFILAIALWAAPPAPPDRLTVRFLDVGQGDSVLIQHPDGTAVLFDGGPPEAGVARLLRRAGVRRLSAVVATHASRDHHGGLQDVLERFPVETLVDGGDGTADPSFRTLVERARRGGATVVEGVAPLDLALADGELQVRVLSPPPRPPGLAPEDPNPRGIVAIVSSRGFDLLLSADAESEALLPLDLPDVDAMKVPHHGSDDPGLPEVLTRAAPELAAIEVGPNTYGHPAPSTLAALRRARVPTFRTDRDGTISLTPTGGSIEVDTER